MKTKLSLLFVAATLAICGLAYGQAPTHQATQPATVVPAGTTFIILVPVQGPPVQYQPIRVTHQCVPHYPAYRHYGGGYRYGGYGYRSYGYTTGTTAIIRSPRTGRAYMVSRRQLGW